MTYRNDLDAAQARIEALERENRALETELARREAPASAAPPVTPPTKRPRVKTEPFDWADLAYLAPVIALVAFVAFYAFLVAWVKR